MALLALILLAAPPTGLTASVERVDLVPVRGATPGVSVDPIGRRITITGARLARPPSGLACPAARTTRSRTVLECTTRQLWAGLSRDRRGLFLDLRVLRGMPLEPELAVPLVAYPVRAMGIPEDCPGHQDVTRAECALMEGDRTEALRWFTAGADGPDASFARLRLGDLAMLDGDVEGAMGRYHSVVSVGPAGRLAAAKGCDLAGTCLTEARSDALADTAGFPAELKAELSLITWRREVILGREHRVMDAIADALWSEPEICQTASTLCQKLLIAGLTSTSMEAREAALRGWLAPEPLKGPHTRALTLAAASASEQVGAPAFAATVLASVSQAVEAKDLDDHLLRIYRLYATAQDPVRAQVILDYARQRLGTRAVEARAWRAARRLFAPRTTPVTAPPAPLSDPAVEALDRDVGLATDLARAALVSSQARKEAP